jgi:hypothetical protein
MGITKPKPDWVKGAPKDPGWFKKLKTETASRLDMFYTKICFEVKLTMAVSVYLHGTNYKPLRFL